MVGHHPVVAQNQSVVDRRVGDEREATLNRLVLLLRVLDDLALGGGSGCRSPAGCGSPCRPAPWSVRKVLTPSSTGALSARTYALPALLNPASFNASFPAGSAAEANRGPVPTTHTAAHTATTARPISQEKRLERITRSSRDKLTSEPEIRGYRNDGPPVVACDEELYCAVRRPSKGAGKIRPAACGPTGRHIEAAGAVSE